MLDLEIHAVTAARVLLNIKIDDSYFPLDIITITIATLCFYIEEEVTSRLEWYVVQTSNNYISKLYPILISWSENKFCCVLIGSQH